MKILVTGGSGMVGHYVIDELQAHGYAVVNADQFKPGLLSHSDSPGSSREAAAALRDSWTSLVGFAQVDVTDYGQVVSAMAECKGVVHLAAIPTIVGNIEEKVFATNTTSTWNVLRAAEQLGVGKVVLGSSYNAIGANVSSIRRGGALLKPLEYFPIDEDHPTRADDAYSISKWVGEQVADAFSLRNPEIQIASLRFNGMWDDEKMRKMQASPVKDPMERAAAFWTYLHIRDAARACRLALEAEWKGHHRLFLNAKDTMLDIPTMDAITKVYPTVPVRRPMPGFDTTISITRSKQVLGWEPLLSWRDPQFAPRGMMYRAS